MNPNSYRPRLPIQYPRYMPTGERSPYPNPPGHLTASWTWPTYPPAQRQAQAEPHSPESPESPPAAPITNPSPQTPFRLQYHRRQVPSLQPSRRYSRPPFPYHNPPRVCPSYRPPPVSNYFRLDSPRLEPHYGFGSTQAPRFGSTQAPRFGSTQAPRYSTRSVTARAEDVWGQNTTRFSSRTPTHTRSGSFNDNKQVDCRPVERNPKKRVRWAMDYEESPPSPMQTYPASALKRTRRQPGSHAPRRMPLQETVSTPMLPVLNVPNPMVAPKVGTEECGEVATKPSRMNVSTNVQSEFALVSPPRASGNQDSGRTGINETTHHLSTDEQIKTSESVEAEAAHANDQLTTTTEDKVEVPQPRKHKFVFKTVENSESTPSESEESDVEQAVITREQVNINNTSGLDEKESTTPEAVSVSALIRIPVSPLADKSSSTNTVENEDTSNYSQLLVENGRPTANEGSENEQEKLSGQEQTNQTNVVDENENQECNNNLPKNVHNIEESLPANQNFWVALSEKNTSGPTQISVPITTIRMYTFEPYSKPFLERRPKRNRNYGSFVCATDDYDEDYVRYEDKAMRAANPRKPGTDKKHYMIMPHHVGMTPVHISKRQRRDHTRPAESKEAITGIVQDVLEEMCEKVTNGI